VLGRFFCLCIAILVDSERATSVFFSFCRANVVVFLILINICIIVNFHWVCNRGVK
jgi:hypothetical protein